MPNGYMVEKAMEADNLRDQIRKMDAMMSDMKNLIEAVSEEHDLNLVARLKPETQDWIDEYKKAKAKAEAAATESERKQRLETSIMTKISSIDHTMLLSAQSKLDHRISLDKDEIAYLRTVRAKLTEEEWDFLELKVELGDG